MVPPNTEQGHEAVQSPQGFQVLRLWWAVKGSDEGGVLLARQGPGCAHPRSCLLVWCAGREVLSSPPQRPWGVQWLEMLGTLVSLVPAAGVPSTHRWQPSAAFSSFFNFSFSFSISFSSFSFYISFSCLAAHQAMLQHLPAHHVSHLLWGRVEAQPFLQVFLGKKGIGISHDHIAGGMKPTGALVSLSIAAQHNVETIRTRDTATSCPQAGAGCAHGHTTSSSNDVWS